MDDRHELRDSRLSFGFRRSFDPGSTLLLSLSAFDQTEHISSLGTLVIKQNVETFVAEAQHVLVRKRFNLVTGLGYDTESQETRFFDSPSGFRPHAANAYAYLNTAPLSFPVTFHVGASVDYLADRDDATPSRTEFNSKVGLTMAPWDGATLRAATFSTLGRQFAISETIEPTQVAGFNQVYDDLGGTQSRRSAIAFDQSISSDLMVGAEWSRRDMRVPFDQSSEEYNWDERNAEIHIYWAATESVALTATYQEEELTRSPLFAGKELIRDIRTRTIPLGIAIYGRNRLYTRLTATHVNQTGRFYFLAAGADTLPAETSFWIADASFGYRLPKRVGTISIEGRNLLDEHITFQETDFFSRQFARERIILFRASVSF